MTTQNREGFKTDLTAAELTRTEDTGGVATLEQKRMAIGGVHALHHPVFNSGIDLCRAGHANQIEFLQCGGADYTGHSKLAAYHKLVLKHIEKPAPVHTPSALSHDRAQDASA